MFPLQSNLRWNANQRVALTTRQSRFKISTPFDGRVVLPESSLSMRLEILCLFLWQWLTNLGVKPFWSQTCRVDFYRMNEKSVVHSPKKEIRLCTQVIASKRVNNRHRKKRSRQWSLGRAPGGGGVEVVNEGFQQGETFYKRFLTHQSIRQNTYLTLSLIHKNAIFLNLDAL